MACDLPSSEISRRQASYEVHVLRQTRRQHRKPIQYLPDIFQLLSRFQGVCQNTPPTLVRTAGRWHSVLTCSNLLAETIYWLSRPVDAASKFHITNVQETRHIVLQKSLKMRCRRREGRRGREEGGLVLSCFFFFFVCWSKPATLCLNGRSNEMSINISF